MSPSFILQDLSAMFQNKKTLISVLSALPDYCPYVGVESWFGPRRSKGIKLSLDPPPPRHTLTWGGGLALAVVLTLLLQNHLTINIKILSIQELILCV